jgi:hypothetical protein
MRHTLNNSDIITQSVHIPTCFNGGHHHRRGIHLVSWDAAVETVCLVTLAQQNSNLVLGYGFNKIKIFNSVVPTYEVNSLAMVVATTTTCRNMDLLCENFRIIKSMAHIVGNL